MDEYPASSGVNTQAPRILLCDDSPIDRNPLSIYLTSQSYEVFCAENGDIALRTLKSQEVDLVLLDLNMPSVSGFDVLAYLQEHRRGLPVIIMSGLSPEDIQPHIHSLPTPALPPLVLKPIDVDKLIALMEMLLSHQMPDLEHLSRETEGAA